MEDLLVPQPLHLPSRRAFVSHLKWEPTVNWRASFLKDDIMLTQQWFVSYLRNNLWYTSLHKTEADAKKDAMHKASTFPGNKYLVCKVVAQVEAAIAPAIVENMEQSE